MKKLNLVLLVVLSLFLIIGNADAQTRRAIPPTAYVYQSSDCSFLTWYGALCQDTDDGKLYKWDGATQSEIAATTADGDVTDVWACTTGNCNALTAAAGDTLDATLADSTIPNKVGTTAALPATCTEGMTYWSSNGDAHYTCTSANTWRADYDQSLVSTGNPAFNTINVVGTNSLNLGSAGAAVGQVTFKNATSGGITVQPITGALGTTTFVLGKTFTDAKWCTYATATGFTCNQDGPAGFVDWTADQGATNIHINNIPDLSAVYQPYDADLTTWAGITPSANVQSMLAAANTAAIKAFLSVDDLVTLSGVADGAVNLGTFTGSTITDNRTIKEALQDMETAFEAAAGHTQNTDTGTTATTFQLDSDAAGPILKNNGGNLEARASGDAAYIGFRALTIQGTTITATTGFSGTLTGNVTGALTGNADTATAASTIVVIDSTDASSYIAMFDSATGTMAIKTDTGLTYNASTGVLTATGFSGPLTGNVTGNASGTAATVTGAAQTAITSLGTLTGLTVSGAIIPNAVGTIDLGSTSAEFRNIFLANGGILYGQADQSATLTSSASTWTASAFAVTGAAAFNGNVTVGDGDADTVTIRSMIIGGNSRAVQIAASVATPTYATGTNELYVAGDIETAGTVYAAGLNTGTGTDGTRAITMNSNTTFTPSGNQLYFLNNVLKVSENGTERDVVTPADSVTWTGATHSFAAVTSFVLPTAAADAAGEMSINTTGHQLLFHVGGASADNALQTIDFDSCANGQVLKTNGSGAWTCADDVTAGSPTLDTVGNPAAAKEFEHAATETLAFSFIGAFSTGSQFLVEQKTGNPSGGVLFEVKVADTDATAARIGDGTNYVQVASNGAVTLAGTAVITAGGIVLGDATPDADGEIGYASNAFKWFANSEDLVLTASANLWTFSSATSATVAFTPSVTLSAGGLLGPSGNAISVSSGGVATFAGTATLTSPPITTAITPISASGATLGTTALEWGHLYLGDGKIIYFGNDQDVRLEHVADTGLLLSDASGGGTTQLQFGDSGTYINQPTDGTLAVTADTILQLTAPNIKLAFDAAAYLNIATADGGATTISAVSDGADVINVGDSSDDQVRVRHTNSATDATWSGSTLYFAQCAATMGFGSPAYIQSTGKPGLADADATATMPAIGLVVVASTDADTPCTILTHGVITETDWNWTPGATIYVADGSAGALTATVGDLSDENDVVQVVGVAITADSILVMPSLVQVVLAAP